MNSIYLFKSYFSRVKEKSTCSHRRMKLKLVGVEGKLRTLQPSTKVTQIDDRLMLDPDAFVQFPQDYPHYLFLVVQSSADWLDDSSYNIYAIKEERIDSVDEGKCAQPWSFLLSDPALIESYPKHLGDNGNQSIGVLVSRYSVCVMNTSDSVKDIELMVQSQKSSARDSLFDLIFDLLGHSGDSFITLLKKPSSYVKLRERLTSMTNGLGEEILSIDSAQKLTAAHIEAIRRYSQLLVHVYHPVLSFLQDLWECQTLLADIKMQIEGLEREHMPSICSEPVGRIDVKAWETLKHLSSVRMTNYFKDSLDMPGCLQHVFASLIRILCEVSAAHTSPQEELEAFLRTTGAYSTLWKRTRENSKNSMIFYASRASKRKFIEVRKPLAANQPSDGSQTAVVDIFRHKKDIFYLSRDAECKQLTVTRHDASHPDGGVTLTIPQKQRYQCKVITGSRLSIFDAVINSSIGQLAIKVANVDLFTFQIESFFTFGCTVQTNITDLRKDSDALIMKACRSGWLTILCYYVSSIYMILVVDENKPHVFKLNTKKWKKESYQGVQVASKVELYCVSRSKERTIEGTRVVVHFEVEATREGYIFLLKFNADKSPSIKHKSSYKLGQNQYIQVPNKEKYFGLLISKSWNTFTLITTRGDKLVHVDHRKFEQFSVPRMRSKYWFIHLLQCKDTTKYATVEPGVEDTVYVTIVRSKGDLKSMISLKYKLKY